MRNASGESLFRREKWARDVRPCTPEGNTEKARITRLWHGLTDGERKGYEDQAAVVNNAEQFEAQRPLSAPISATESHQKSHSAGQTG